MVEGDAAVAGAKERYLLPPGEVVAAGAMGERDSVAFAVRLVVHPDPIDLGRGHARGSFASIAGATPFYARSG